MDTKTYLTDLGIPAAVTKWDAGKVLPPFLVRGKRFSRLAVFNTMAILIDRSNDFNIPDMAWESARIESLTNKPVVYELKEPSPYQKTALINERIGFIVPGRFVYAPKLLLVLDEKPLASRSVRKLRAERNKRLTPTAQFLWLYLLYAGGRQFQKGLVRNTGLARGVVSTALTGLEDVGLIHRTKTGVQNEIHLGDVHGETADRKELLRQSWELMTTPVTGRMTLAGDGATMPEGLLPAGETALAERTMLGGPDVPVYAANGDWRSEHQDGFRVVRKDIEDPPVGSFEVEFWKYDPQVLADAAGDGLLADPVSVALSLRDVKDTRLEASVQEMIDGLFGEEGR